MKRSMLMTFAAILVAGWLGWGATAARAQQDMQGNQPAAVAGFTSDQRFRLLQPAAADLVPRELVEGDLQLAVDLRALTQTMGNADQHPGLVDAEVVEEVVELAAGGGQGDGLRIGRIE